MGKEDSLRALGGDIAAKRIEGRRAFLNRAGRPSSQIDVIANDSLSMIPLKVSLIYKKKIRTFRMREMQH